MSLVRKNNEKKLRRAHRVRSRLRKSALPRVSVFRSLNHLYAQIIDDVAQATMVSCSSRELDVKGEKRVQAQAVGVELAKRAKEKGIERVQFDRGPFLYHGRVKALAEGLREGGLNV